MSAHLGRACECRLVLVRAPVCHMSRCRHMAVSVHVLVCVCVCGCVPGCIRLCVCSQRWVSWVTYVCSALVSMSPLCMCRSVCVCLAASVCACVMTCLCVCCCAHVLVCACASPGAATSDSCRASWASPCAPLTAVFYHHLPRKGAQEDGDK